MESANAKLLEDHQSSRRKRKITIIISLIVLFTLIISSIISVLTILRHKVEYQSLSNATPVEAIRAVCSLTPSSSLCLRQILELQTHSQNSSQISPSEIFALSLHASFNQLNILNSESQIVIVKVNRSSRIFSSLQTCGSLISDSFRLVNKSMTTIGIVPDEKFFKDIKTVGNLKEWMSRAKKKLEKCSKEMEDNLDGLVFGQFYLVRMKIKVFSASNYVENSLVILAKMDTILDMFYHPLQSILSNFVLSASGFDFGIVFFGSQYLLLVFLFCLLLRLY